jgi:hypothetical protein
VILFICINYSFCNVTLSWHCVSQLFAQATDYANHISKLEYKSWQQHNKPTSKKTRTATATMGHPSTRSTPPGAAKKRSTKNNVISVDKEDEEDDDVDTSGAEHSGSSDVESQDAESIVSHTESEAEADSVDAEGSEDESEDDVEGSEDESEDDAEGEEDNESEGSTKKNTLAMAAEDHDKLTEDDDDSRSYVIDHEAEVNEEDKLGRRTPTFSDARVIAFIKDNNIDPKDYASFHKSMKIPKVKKHLTPEQSHHILQFIGK